MVGGSGTPASSTTKTGRNDIAEILLKVVLKHKKSINQSIYLWSYISNSNSGSNSISYRNKRQRNESKLP